MQLLILALIPTSTALWEPSIPVAWRKCVVTTAEKWAMNRDGADVVADGAFGACQTMEPENVDEREIRRTRQSAIAAVLNKRRS